MVEGTFHRAAGRGLACVLPAEHGQAIERAEKPVSYLPCLKIGTVAIGDERGKIEAVLGQPDRVMPMAEDVEARAYFIPQRSVVRPYYVVTYLREQAVAVQLIGPPTEMALAFSSVRLGDNEQQVVDALGLPAGRCPSPRGETWLWPPFPIGVEMKDGVVAAIQVSWPRR